MATRVAFQRRQPALFEQREEARHRIECVRATAGGEIETPFVAALEDISTFGCRLSGTEQLEINRRVWLRLPGSTPVVATVVWTERGAAGCRFDTPISQGLMRSLLVSVV